MNNIREMLVKCVENYVARNENKYYFTLNDKYFIPSALISSNRKRINILKNRNKLLKDQSSYSKNMKSYLRQLKVSYVQEFIVFIQNSLLWNNILSSLNLQKEEYEKYKSINYFSLDYFLEDYFICIEVDSDYHKSRKILDKARDIYLKYEYNIETLRFYNFEKSDYQLELIELNNKINSINPISNPSSYFDYRYLIINNFIYENEYLLTMVENFINIVGDDIFKRDKFIITEKDYNELSNGIIFENNITPKMLIDDFTELFKNLLNISIIVCKNIVSYNINELIKIINSIDNISYMSIVGMFNNRVPYWVTEFKGGFPSTYKSCILNSTGEDIFILNNIDIILKTYV